MGTWGCLGEGLEGAGYRKWILIFCTFDPLRLLRTVVGHPPPTDSLLKKSLSTHSVSISFHRNRVLFQFPSAKSVSPFSSSLVFEIELYRIKGLRRKCEEWPKTSEKKVMRNVICSRSRRGINRGSRMGELQ